MKKSSVSHEQQPQSRRARPVHSTAAPRVLGCLANPRRIFCLLLLVTLFAAGTASVQADDVWVRKGPFYYSNGQDRKPKDSRVVVSDTSLSATNAEGKTNQINWSLPPERLREGDKVTLTIDASTNPTPPVFGSWQGNCFDGVSGDENAGSFDGATRDGSPHSGSITFKFKPGSSGPYMRVRAGRWDDYGGDMTGIVTWKYERAAGDPVTKAHLSASLDCGTLEVVPNQNSETCHIIISGWRGNTADRVEVIFPLQTDGFGSQGSTGVVVPIGQGSEAPANMSGSRGPDGSFGKSYSWTLFVRARGNATAGTKTIPITVRQKGAGEVKLQLKVRVVPGRGKQVGPRRDGEGTNTGGTGSTPPITSATSSTGLSARLGCETLVLVPGAGSESCTIFIKGWRTGTANQVEVFLPQESRLRGNLGNDLVAFPGSSKVDPANMGRNANGEYAFGMGFRAMERAPGGTTMIEIIVRQPGHEPVRLVMRVAVNARRSNVGVRNPGTSTATGPSRNIPTRNNVVVSAASRQRAAVLYDDGMRLAEEEKWPQAIEQYRKALHSNPKLDECWEGLGEAYGKQGKWAEAEKAFREAVRQKPGESYYHAQLAGALLKQGRRDAAMKEAQVAIRLGLQDHEVFDELGITVTIR